MTKRIAVLGAGAIGSSVGADLTAAGHDVTIVDQWPAQVAAMNARGLRVVMPDLELRTPMRAMHLCDLQKSRSRLSGLRARHVNLGGEAGNTSQTRRPVITPTGRPG